MKKNIILIGGGGHCKVCIDVIEQVGLYNIAGIVDIPEKLHQRTLGYEMIATDDDLPQLSKEYENFLITVGQIKSPEPRINLFKTLKRLGVKLPVVVSPLAYVSRHARISEGTIIMHHALVNAGAKIGKNCIINSRALIEHDAIVHDHCHIATSAIINGGVEVGEATFFGSNAIAREYVEIGDRCIIGGGGRVWRSLPSSSMIKKIETLE
ncbi:MAG: putative acetyltransferase EpsM [Syntrophus sp. PtaB.Bin075]|nr:MAG: putative acetyltransferase EpsM [Syntrophus sp. PtaB.Bin075]